MTLKEMRKEKKLKQWELAERLDVERSVISKWENGGFLPSIENLIKLADVYNCTIDELVKSAHSPPQSQSTVGE